MNIDSIVWRVVVIFSVIVATALGGCSDEAAETPGATTAGSSGTAAVGGGWASLGGGMDWPVEALAVGADGAVYAGGRFTEAGGVEAEYVAKWDGSKWSAMPGKFSMDVAALAIYDDGSGPALHTFSAEGGGLRLSKWTGDKWVPLGDTINGTVGELQTVEVGGKKLLLAGGEMQSIGQTIVGSFAQWDGKVWAPGLDSSFNNSVFAITPMEGGKVAVGGWFSSVSFGKDFAQAQVKGVGIWDHGKWTSPGGGIDGTVNALAAFDDGTGPALYAGGEFTETGGQAARNIARWDGKAWQEVGGGIDGTVQAMTVLQTPAGPRLIVGGDFETAGSTPAANIAMWDGKQWTALGEGVDDAVRALAAHDGTLYVAGEFSQAGGQEANKIARWSPAPGR